VTKPTRRLYIEEWRAYRNLTQERLESLSGISQQTISDIENSPERKRQPVTLSALAGALDTTPERLYSNPWEVPPPNGDAAPVKPQPPALPELEERLKGKITIDGIELTDEEKQKILAMAKILRGQ
jgi:transcriptional regulator with XRE-family HTH domain